jgi:hypothetical protein
MAEQKPQSEMPVPQPAPPPERPRRRSAPGIVFPMLLIFIGVMLLLHTTGVLPVANWGRLWVLWPVLLILIGVDVLLRRAPAAVRILLALVVLGLLVWASVYLVMTAGPLEASRPVQQEWARQGIEEGDVTLDMGAGRLTLEGLGQSGADLFARVDLEAAQEPEWSREGSLGRLRLTHSGWVDERTWVGDYRWNVQLSPQVSFRSLDVKVGAGESILRLESLRVDDLKVNMGVGKINCTLPGGGGAGTVWQIDSGIGAIEVIVPAEAPIRIKAHAGLGDVSTHGAFSQSGDYYLAPGCKDSEKCVTVEVSVGIGAINIR